MREYDLLLAFTTFRRLAAYLPIIKSLSQHYSVGLYVFDLPADEAKKTQQTNRLFLELCTHLGASVVAHYPVHTKLFVLPQWPYSQTQLQRLREQARWDRCFMLMALASGNMDLDKVKEIPIDKYLVIDKDLYQYRLEKMNDVRYQGVDGNIIEIGSPFEEFRVFEDLEFDYLIANPTPHSLPESKDKAAYLKNVLALISHLSVSDRVVLKPHNATESNDYILNRRIFNVLNARPVRALHRILCPPVELVARLASHSPILQCSRLKEGLYQVLISIYYAKLLRRVDRLADLTVYHNFGLEVFLPNVRKGLITGLSNSIWHALFAKLPVYNCVDRQTIQQRKDKTHYYSMNYFGVPFCAGKLAFDEEHYTRVSDRTRQRDLIQFLERSLTGSPARQGR